jgi:hypothetical protein
MCTIYPPLSHLFFSFSPYRKTKKAAIAKKCLEKTKAILGQIDASLAKVASAYVAPATNGVGSPEPSKKRKAEGGSSATPTASPRKKKKTVNKNSALAQREERAMEMLSSFVQERGGQRSQAATFSARVTTKTSGGKFDTNFFNETGRRFRSMLEVGRFLGLVDDGGVNRAGGGGRVRRKAGSTRDQDAEKKKMRKELERLRKAHQRASKALDDFTTDDKDSLYPMDDLLLMETVEDDIKSTKERSLVTATTCAAARVPDIEGFPGLPERCIPDILMTWDFLCTFERALSLTPIGLDDFVDALVYVPPEGQMGDDLLDPPLILAESHLALLKLLFQDKSSDDWWWSVLESDEAQPTAGFDDDEEKKPPIKIDISLLLAETEDHFITTSWLRVLDNIRNLTPSNGKDIKSAIKAAKNVASNKWAIAYLRKTLRSFKIHGIEFVRRAAAWLVDRMKEARPDLLDSGVSKDELHKARMKAIEAAGKLMDDLPDSVPTVTSEDLSDNEYEEDDDEDSDDSDDDEIGTRHSRASDESQRVASAIPPKPLPSFVDMFLPPMKPTPNEDFVNAFTWPQLVGATLSRTLHRKKRILNEVDDSLRVLKHLPPLTVSQRRERERILVSRILTECVDTTETISLVESAVQHLCEGGCYLHMSAVQRLCMLRLLIEAAYDTGKVYDVVSGNYKQWTSAMKALEIEERRAKREAKEKAAGEQAVARGLLAEEAREKFLDETREEIKKLNDKSKEFSDEVMESLTYEDIIDFDDDIKADYEALPGPDSFNKTEVSQMVARLQQETAFDTDELRVITMDELLERDRRDLEEMEGQLIGFGGENALLDPSLDRESVRSVERLRRDIQKAKVQAEKLPEQRHMALEQLKEAIGDGTIKVLRSALAVAKKAKLTGPDDETGGEWAVDLMRDAALELEKAKQNKRVVDARKDLVAKRNKCFIRCDPLGEDRFGNHFWSFNCDTGGHIWAETEYSVRNNTEEPASKQQHGFLDLWRDGPSLVVGAKDMESDFIGSNDENSMFSRQEYHSTGFTASLVKRHWGCHATEDSLRAVIKLLDSRGVRESRLKTKLKDALDEIVESDEKHDAVKDESPDEESGHGDESVFQEARRATLASGELDIDLFDEMSSAIGAQVRMRLIIDTSKDPPAARYENGSVLSWKVRRTKVGVPSEGQVRGEDEDETPSVTIESPVWRVQTDRGKTVWCNDIEVLQSIVRYRKWKDGQGYFESDAALLAYRNSLGRHCGRAADAPYASSPNFLARLMVGREGDLYPKLKIRSFDNNWGGMSGARGLWTNTMKNFAYDFQTVQKGLLTLENAFFELTAGFSEYESAQEIVGDIQDILDDPVQRVDIELESIENSVPGLWNSPLSRAVFIQIVSTCKTTGFLALGLDLLCRNTTKYLHRHKLVNALAEQSANGFPTMTTSRTTRRQNAWQQQQSSKQEWY